MSRFQVETILSGLGCLAGLGAQGFRLRQKRRGSKGHDDEARRVGLAREL